MWQDILTKEFLTEELLIQHKTASQLAKELDCSYHTIHRFCSKYEIDIRIDKYDLVGKKFDYLEVLEPIPAGNGHKQLNVLNN